MNFNAKMNDAYKQKVKIVQSFNGDNWIEIMTGFQIGANKWALLENQIKVFSDDTHGGSTSIGNSVRHDSLLN